MNKAKITKVVIKNFKTHKNTTIDFSDFTALVGPTDNGKSAAIGAIVYCLNNRPSGDKFIRREYELDEHGDALLDEEGKAMQKPALTCDVETFFDNGKSVRHVKGPTQHYYQLNENGVEVLKLESFGVGPVKEVMDFHGMHEVNFFGEKQSLNICPQMDQPFFLGESGPTKAAMIGKMANTDVIDVAIKNVDTKVRAAKKAVKEKKVKLKEVNDDLKELKGLAKMEKDLEKLSKLITKAEEAESKANTIRSTVLALKTLQAQKAKLEVIMAYESESEKLKGLCEAISATLSKINAIIKINKLLIADLEKKAKLAPVVNIDTAELDNIKTVAENVASMLKKKDAIIKANEKLLIEQKKLQKIEKIANSDIDIDEILKKLGQSKINLDMYVQISGVNRKLKAELERKKAGLNVITKLECEYSVKQGKYLSALKQHKMCPTCLGEITEERLAAIQDIL